ncbi:MAG: hypothetical protein O3A47_00450 [Chloroflexi bacterium]|nr:hypothetical protein [Chloroflexota bacterium]
MGPVESRTRSVLADGAKLFSFPGMASFTMQYEQEYLVLLLGEKPYPTRLKWSCLEGIPDLLGGRGWVKIGAVKNIGEPDTLHGYLTKCVKRMTAGYVAAILQKTGIVQASPGRPAQVRLNDDWDQ